MQPVTLAEALSLQDTQRKYGNEKVVIDGMTFDGTRTGMFLSVRASTSPISSIPTRTGAPSWRT